MFRFIKSVVLFVALCFVLSAAASQASAQFCHGHHGYGGGYGNGYGYGYNPGYGSGYGAYARPQVKVYKVTKITKYRKKKPTCPPVQYAPIVTPTVCVPQCQPQYVPVAPCCGQ